MGDAVPPSKAALRAATIKRLARLTRGARINLGDAIKARRRAEASAAAWARASGAREQVGAGAGQSAGQLREAARKATRRMLAAQCTRSTAADGRRAAAAEPAARRSKAARLVRAQMDAYRRSAEATIAARDRTIEEHARKLAHLEERLSLAASAGRRTRARMGAEVAALRERLSSLTEALRAAEHAAAEARSFYSPAGAVEAAASQSRREDEKGALGLQQR